MGSRTGSRSRCARMARLLRVSLLATVTLVAFGSASASAATIGKSGSAITYSAAAGEVNNLVVSLASGTYTYDDSGANITASGGCTRVNATRATCPASGVTSLSIDTGNMNDLAWNTAATNSTITGGDGNDRLIGAAGADVLIACAGDDSETGGGGADVLLDGFFNCAGGGNDSLDGGTGADAIFGGPGDDTVTYAGRTASVFVTLDDSANDGGSGEGDNVHMDIEDVTGGSGNDRFTGDTDANTLRGEGGNDLLDGGLGADFFDGGAGNDDMQSLDGEIDSVNCGTGFDSGLADFADFVSPNCESLEFGGALPEDFEDFENFEFPVDCLAAFAADEGGLGGGVGATGGGGDLGGFDPLSGACPSARRLACSLVRISSRPAELDSGAIEIRVSMPRAAPAACRGKLRLDSVTPKAGTQNGRKLTLGSEPLVLRAGQSKRFEVEINRPGRRLLHAAARPRVRANVLAREDGELTRVTSQVVKVDLGG
jgi:hypothetical protein